MTEETFANGMAMLTAVWPERAPGDDAMKVYWAVLQDVGDVEFQQAVETTLRESRYFPRPAELLAAVPTGHLLALLPDGRSKIRRNGDGWDYLPDGSHWATLTALRESLLGQPGRQPRR